MKIKDPETRVTWRNITNVEYKVEGGIKTLTIYWDNEEVEKIYGSCLDKVLAKLQEDIVKAKSAV